MTTGIDPRVLTIPSFDTLRLAATGVGPSTAAATIIYVHGLLCDRSYWTPVIEQVHARAGAQITQIAYDQRGHGDSGRPDRRAITTLAQLADDLDAVLACATGEIVVVTHSAGSLVAAAHAQRHPVRAASLSGLVLFGGAAEFPEFPGLPRWYTTVPEYARRLRHTSFDALAAAAMSLAQRRFRRLSRRLGSRAALICGEHATDPRVLADTLSAYRRFTVDDATAELVRGIPSLVIAGELDRIVPPAQSIRLADKIEADYELVTGAGHALPHTDPDRAAQAIVHALDAAFLHDRPPGQDARVTAQHGGDHG